MMLPASRREWLAAAEAMLLLGGFRLLILAVPNTRLVKGFGTAMEESPRRALDEDELATVRLVRWAVHGISRRTPWTANCLPQALTAKRMLARRDIVSTMYVGAAFTERRDALRAHAWLRSGDVAVTGGLGNEATFGAIASYT